MANAGVALADNLARRGDRPCLVTEAGVVSYAELAAKVADRSHQLGAERRLVLVRAANTVESVVTYLAALRGRHPVLLAAGGPEPEASTRLVERFDPDVVAGVIDGEWVIDERRRGSTHRLHPDLALLMSTSGSTGSPRLVRLSHRNVESNAAAIAAYLGLRADDRGATTLPMSYCYGLSIINSHLHAGASVFLTERSVTDPEFWEQFRAVGATSLAGVPYTFELLERIGFEHFELPSLRYVTQAGGRLDPHVVRKYATLGQESGWDFVVMYGQTEATARMAYLPPALALLHPGAIGVAIPGGELTIEPFEGAAPGSGELVYRGPNVMLGYAEDASDLRLGATIDRLRTGDVARATGEGVFEVIGRRARFAKLFGLRIDLDDVEARLRASGVNGLCTSDDRHLIIGTRAEHATAARAAVEQLCVPPRCIRVVPLDEMPRLANGKADYAALRLAGTATMETASSVRDVYAQLLRCDTVRDDDTFVSLGGDSLSYAEASVALEELLGPLPPDWHVTPVALLEVPPARRRRTNAVDTTVAVRAIAMVLIVANHTRLIAVPGSAHVLIAVAGFNFGRFTVPSGRWWRAAWRIALPSALWIATIAALTGDVGWAHVLLLNGWLGQPNDAWMYWFIETLVQVLVALGIVLLVPAVRRLQRRHPFEFATGLALLALIVRLDAVPIPELSYRMFRPHEVLWLFAVGWAAATATTRTHRMLLSAMVVGAVRGSFTNADHALFVAGGVLLVVWFTVLRVPFPLNRVLGAVAGASLAIYLTHWQLYRLVIDDVGPIAATAICAAAGIVATRASSLGFRRARRAFAEHARVSSRRVGAPAPARRGARAHAWSG